MADSLRAKSAIASETMEQFEDVLKRNNLTREDIDTGGTAEAKYSPSTATDATDAEKQPKLLKDKSQYGRCIAQKVRSLSFFLPIQMLTTR